MMAAGIAISEGHRHRQDDQLEGHGQADEHVLEDGAPAQDRGAPVALHELAEPDHVLDQDRLVEPVVLADLDRVLLGVGVAEQGHDGIAGDRPHHHEHHEA